MHAIGRSASSPSNAIFLYPHPMFETSTQARPGTMWSKYAEATQSLSFTCSSMFFSFFESMMKAMYIIIRAPLSPKPVIFPATFLAPGMVSKMVSSGARESAQPMMAVWGAWPSSTSCWRAAALVLEPQGQPFTKRRLPSWRWDRWHRCCDLHHACSIILQ